MSNLITQGFSENQQSLISSGFGDSDVTSCEISCSGHSIASPKVSEKASCEISCSSNLLAVGTSGIHGSSVTITTTGYAIAFGTVENEVVNGATTILTESYIVANGTKEQRIPNEPNEPRYTYASGSGGFGGFGFFGKEPKQKRKKAKKTKKRIAINFTRKESIYTKTIERNDLILINMSNIQILQKEIENNIKLSNIRLKNGKISNL